MTWFTYPPEGEPGKQAWMIGQGQIMVTGGEVIDSIPGLIQPSMEVFAPGAQDWAVGPPPSVPAHGTTGAEVNGLLVLPGGSDIAGTTSYNRAIQVYTPAPSDQ